VAADKLAKVKKASSVVAPKFRGPNGETWSGRGLKPKWLVSLLEQGNTADQYLIPT
jgi:DNA-binding protein H-NS